MKTTRLIQVCLLLLPLELLAQGFTNRVLVLNGTSGYAAAVTSTNIQNPNAITIEAWVYPVTPNGHTGGFLIGKSDGQSGDSQRTWELKWQGNNVGFAVYFALPTATNQPHYAELNAPVLTGVWTHVTATYAVHDAMKLYTNGVLSAMATIYDGFSFYGAAIRQSNQPLLFGANPVSFNTFMSGFMDEIRIWNKARTPNEIASQQFCRLTGNETNLVGYWTFDDETVRDLTPQGTNGTLIGGAIISVVSSNDTVHNGICGAGYSASVSLQFLPSAGFHQKIYGYAGTSVTVEASTNLFNWSPILILPNFSGELEFTDPAALNYRQRFYRFVLP
jgi:hypothetical protein